MRAGGKRGGGARSLPHSASRGLPAACPGHLDRDHAEHTQLSVTGLKETIPAARKVWPELQSRLEQVRRPL